MRIYYNTNGLAHHRLDEALEWLAELGYDGVALTPDVAHLDPYRTTPREVAHVRRRLSELGLGVVVEGGARYVLDPRRKHHPTLLSSDGFQRRQDFYRRLLDLAADLGAPLISIWSGRREEDTPPGERALDLLASRLEPVLRHAERRGVLVAFEPEPGMLVDTCEGVESLRRRVGKERLFLTADTGHLAVNETPPLVDHLRRHRAALRNVHLDDARRGRHEHLFFGEGSVDFAAVAETLTAFGFDGPASVELSRHGPDGAETARRALSALRAAGWVSERASGR